jgi:hypothetical protein
MHGSGSRPEVKFLRATRHRSHAAMSRRWAGQSRRKTEYHTDWRSTFACRWRRAATKAGSLRCQPRPKGGDGPASSLDRRCSPQGEVAGGMIAARRLAAIVAANVPECLFWVISGGAGPPAAWQVNLNKRTPELERAHLAIRHPPAGRQRVRPAQLTLSDPLHGEQPTADRVVSAE